MIDYISIISQQVRFNYGKIIRISKKKKNFITNYRKSNEFANCIFGVDFARIIWYNIYI